MNRRCSLKSCLLAQRAQQYQAVCSLNYLRFTVRNNVDLMTADEGQVEPVLCKGAPVADIFATLDRLAEVIAQKHLEH